MTLIKSISGIRGTIGGTPGDALTPIDIVKFTSAFVKLISKGRNEGERIRIVVGRDARISGQMVNDLVCGTLTACGADVTDCGLASTPTVEMAVTFEKADGGIILTASHNPKQWNALKLLNSRGEFISAEEGAELLRIAESEDFAFADIDSIGSVTKKDFTEKHIEAVINHPLVDAAAIRKAGFKAVVDAVNSVGGIIMPALLEKLGVECIKLYCTPDGRFPHNPEPLPENLRDLSAKVTYEKADLGISVDPDVDRLALICSDGTPFGEEYTLVSVADYVLSHRKGATVSNLSSSRALRDITEAAGEKYYSSAVGEVNVTAEMKRVNAVIGGEGNGGVIMPDLHYGRDAMIGIALFLSNMATKGTDICSLRESYPKYHISKNKIQLSDPVMIDRILDLIRKEYASERITDTDGVKIDFDSQQKWVHLRKSNTEPIIRIYAEAHTPEEADSLAEEIIGKANGLIQE